MRLVFSGEAVTQESLGRSPRRLSDLNAGLSVITDIGRGEDAKRRQDFSPGVCRIYREAV